MLVRSVQLSLELLLVAATYQLLDCCASTQDKPISTTKVVAASLSPDDVSVSWEQFHAFVTDTTVIEPSIGINYTMLTC